MERLSALAEHVEGQLDRRRFLRRLAIGTAGVAASLLAPGITRARDLQRQTAAATISLTQKQAPPILGANGKPATPDACWWYCYYIGGCNVCGSGKSTHRCHNYCTDYDSYFCLSPCSSFCYSFNPC